MRYVLLSGCMTSAGLGFSGHFGFPVVLVVAPVLCPDVRLLWSVVPWPALPSPPWTWSFSARLRAVLTVFSLVRFCQVGFPSLAYPPVL